jgi:predicted transcriptional regulator
MEITMGNYTTSRTDTDVLSAIATFLEERPMVAVNEIAEKVGCERKTVIRATNRLVRQGRLIISEEKGKPNRYRIPE